jgi:hypothetical protein
MMSVKSRHLLNVHPDLCISASSSQRLLGLRQSRISHVLFQGPEQVAVWGAKSGR